MTTMFPDDVYNIGNDKDAAAAAAKNAATAGADTERYEAMLESIVSGSLKAVNYKTGLRWNPPPHNVTKAYSPLAYQQYLSRATGFRTERVDAIQRYERSFKNTGFLYQDVQTASGPRYNIAELYGFRFTYNPAKIEITDSNDPSIDWTLSAKQEHTKLLTGTQNITVELLLNRIPDMTALANGQTGTKHYPVPLSETDVQGILERGTDYDLEYLYRVVNGDPRVGPSLNYASGAGASANFGWLTMVPVWMRLNKNMRFKGSVTNISVNHFLFNTQMIPMLTNVTLTFARIPVPTGIVQNDKLLQTNLQTSGFLNIGNKETTP